MKRSLPAFSDSGAGLSAENNAPEGGRGCVLSSRGQEVMDCGLGQWASYDQGEKKGMPVLFDRAHQKVETILASHRVKPFDVDTERDTRKILEDAGSHLSN